MLGNTDFSLTHVPKLKTVIMGANLRTRVAETHPTGATHYAKTGHQSFDIECLVLSDKLLTNQYLGQYAQKERPDTLDDNARKHMNNTWLISGSGIVQSAPNAWYANAVEKTWAAEFRNYCTSGEMFAKVKAVISGAKLTDEALALLPTELGGTGSNADPVKNFTTASWSRSTVRRAAELKILPGEIQTLGTNHTAAITRGQFAALATALYETVTDTQITYPSSCVLNDSSDENLLKMYHLGVVKGTGFADNGCAIVEPDSLITREQAAVMLARARTSSPRSWKRWPMPYLLSTIRSPRHTDAKPPSAFSS